VRWPTHAEAAQHDAAGGHTLAMCAASCNSHALPPRTSTSSLILKLMAALSALYAATLWRSSTSSANCHCMFILSIATTCGVGGGSEGSSRSAGHVCGGALQWRASAYVCVAPVA
jgi:hypothetical protein